MEEFYTFVIYLHYREERKILAVLVLNLKILPVMSQPPKGPYPLGNFGTIGSTISGRIVGLVVRSEFTAD